MLQKSLDIPRPPRSGAKVSTLDPPAPQPKLIRALDSLRKRGWRAEQSESSAALVAWFRQLADPDVPKPVDPSWRTCMLGSIEKGSTTLKIYALEAVPEPLSDEAAKVVMKALADPDWGVVRVACAVAGKSKRPEFATPLVQIVDTAHELFLQNAAVYAAIACEARMPLWEALAKGITERERWTEALDHLIQGTIEFPAYSGGGGNSNFPRDQRVAIQAAWRSFLHKYRTRLGSGKKISPPDAVTSAGLTGANFDPVNPAVNLRFKDGTEWPPKRKK